MIHATRPRLRASAEPFTLAGLVARLRREGLRVTPCRHAILQALLASDRPQSLEGLQKAAAPFAQGEAPDFTTVSRLMVVLEGLALARKVNLGRSTSHYELTDCQHYRDHLVCTGCGQITPLDDAPVVARMQRRVAQEHGFTQIRRSLEFFGRCGDCSTPEPPR